MSGLTIGQVAKNAGVGVETVRFYEREGLLPEPPRRASGYRIYAADAVQRIRFVRQAKDLGFTLKEIGELLALRLEANGSCADVRQHAVAKITDIDMRIASLQRMRMVLLDLASVCSGSGPTTDCPILAALDNDDSGGKS